MNMLPTDKEVLGVYKSRCESLSFESGLLQCANKQLQAQLATAENENKRLKEALELISDQQDLRLSTGSGYDAKIDKIAKRALKE